MALTADQKEAIMAARGERAAAPAPKSKTRRYDMRFADGKGATVLDMGGGDSEDVIAGVTAMFREGYVVSMTLT